MGKTPMVHIWHTDISPTWDTKKPLATLGANGFFLRGICAIVFSWDNKYLSAIGCDDMHMMGIFDTNSGTLVAQAPCQNGIPPQVSELVCS